MLPTDRQQLLFKYKNIFTTTDGGAAHTHTHTKARGVKVRSPLRERCNKKIENTLHSQKGRK